MSLEITDKGATRMTLKINRKRLKKICPFMLMSLSCVCIADDVVINTALISDDVYRGISLSDSKAVLKLGFDKNFENGLFVGANLSRHNKSSYFNRSGRKDLYAGYFKEMANDMAIEYSILYYHFDADFPKSWNYHEIKTDFHLNHDINFTLAYADQYYRVQDKSFYFAGTWQPALGDDWYGLVSTGVTYPSASAQLNNLYHLTLGLSKNISRWNFQVGYHYGDKNVEIIHGPESSGKRLNFQISLQVY